MKNIITAENISKAYRIGIAEKRSDTMLGMMWQGLKAPFRNFRNIKNLSKLSGDDESIFWALRDLNFSIQEGEVVGIIGHNGAGKSTLLKILSRITDPSSGRILIHGRVSSLLEVGTGFHPDLTGRENIYMNGTILGMRKKEIDNKLNEIIEFSGISKHIDTPVKRYSSGMAVRLAFSVAAHLEPEILIIDEVLAVGDAEFQKKCMGKMDDVAKNGRTVLFVSHNLSFVSSLCKRGILLENGRIVYHGDAGEAINKYSKHKARELSYKYDGTNQNGTYIEEVTVQTSEAPGIQMLGKSFSISFVLQHDAPLINPAISFQIVNSSNVPVLHVLNLNREVCFAQSSGKTEILCRIPLLRLYPDHYSISVNFNPGVGNVKMPPLIGICPFEVIHNDVRELYWYKNAATYIEDHPWFVL